jgi:phosphoribosylanthranilate isomerase
MSRTRVKICGITRLEDARRAVDLGADALGFVFWAGSPRALGAQAAAAIVRELPPFVDAVGVFVDAPLDQMRRIVRDVGLTAVQLHGHEPESVWLEVPGRCIRAVAIDEGFEPQSLAAWPPTVLPLVDAHDPVRRGGTGMTADWGRAAAASRVRRLVLAGGLRPENIETAIRAVRPYAVDVSSGVECEPGIKDHTRLQAFFQGVARADASERT